MDELLAQSLPSRGKAGIGRGGGKFGRRTFATRVKVHTFSLPCIGKEFILTRKSPRKKERDRAPGGEGEKRAAAGGKGILSVGPSDWPEKKEVEENLMPPVPLRKNRMPTLRITACKGPTGFKNADWGEEKSGMGKK